MQTFTVTGTVEATNVVKAMRSAYEEYVEIHGEPTAEALEMFVIISGALAHHSLPETITSEDIERMIQMTKAIAHVGDIDIVSS